MEAVRPISDLRRLLSKYLINNLYLSKYDLAAVVYKKIWVNLLCDFNNGGRHKAMLVSNGHLTDIPFQKIRGSFSPWYFSSCV